MDYQVIVNNFVFLIAQGFLGIGAKESLRFSAHAAGFDEIVREDRIYQKRSEL